MTFYYPKNKHIRSESPPEFNNYKKFKPFLQNEFSRHCVYCQTPDTLNNYESFGVDHYKPKSIFPHLKTNYTNLYYSCNKCNSRKGDFWQSPSNLNKFIPNPCDHIMFDHLKFTGADIQYKSEAGKFTIDILQLDNEIVIAFRNAIITAIEAIYSKLEALELELEKINKVLPALKYFKLNRAKKEKINIEFDIKKLNTDLNVFLGKDNL